VPAVISGEDQQESGGGGSVLQQESNSCGDVFSIGFWWPALIGDLS
jgi:hypothetical protein